MGHGSNDKLYITHTEHSVLGSHSASSGFRAKQEAPHPGARTPFDCCSLSFQPFENSVCARNSDGTGNVFDLVNIIPWLKQHNNTNPITKEPLTPADLIQLHYSRKASGEIHDPISFKPFSEHSHILAIATTGNVFLAESIKGGKDLVNDVPFKKQDVITLQNPHGLAPASVPSQSSSSSTHTTKAVATPTPPVAAVKSKEATPWNISPYSSGLPGASLTSTSVDPTVAGGAASKLVWDEEELMFEAISNPLKGKGKEKDVGKRRAYVRVVTSLGGGSLNLELFCEKAPKTCYNFLMLAREGKYDNCLFHRLIPGFMIQTGDPTGTGSGGQSFWETPFRDEYDLKGAAKHDSRGVLAMANKGANTNGYILLHLVQQPIALIQMLRSQFYLTFKPVPHLDKKHTVFGKLVGGEDVLNALENIPRKDGTERPAKSVKITEVVIYQDPFDEYKTRLATKLAKRAEGPKIVKPEKKEGDDINWFGVKVGSEGSVNDKIIGGGVGKYLNLKRPQAATGISEEPLKKRKLGFGNFESW
ncbi:cyclophilin-like domain-containing protein [Lentinula aciculospora]|uniref:RING-type E3 ubiquitin transferase n=1 Tax=Lentinula aciculospora TaxID=153920 RepID=A0A9W9DUC4_9AGAR|nr:cyclophilin-like domain-containing protein [Lentinula aciculospora]